MTYIKMAMNGLKLAVLYTRLEIRVCGGLSRKSFLLEFMGHCNINLHVQKCLLGVVPSIILASLLNKTADVVGRQIVHV